MSPNDSIKRKGMEWEIVFDKKLARLGDAIINFVMSAALTLSTGTPQGVKLKNRILRMGWNSCGITEKLKVPKMPSDVKVEDAAEALIAFAWSRNLMEINTMLFIAMRAIDENPDKDLDRVLVAPTSELLRRIVEELC